MSNSRMPQLPPQWLCSASISILFLLACGCEKSNRPSQADIERAKAEMTGKAIGDYTYKNQLFQGVQVKEVTDQGFRVTHKHGSAMFLFQHMPAAVQQRFGFDATAAAATPVPAPGAGDAAAQEGMRQENKMRDIKSTELAGKEFVKKEIHELQAAIPQLQQQIVELQAAKEKSEAQYRKRMAYSTAWPAVEQRWNASISGVEQRIQNVRSKIAALQRRL